MHWYNAAMSKPFQFSIRRMLAGMALFGMGAFMFSIYSPVRYSKAGPLLYCAAFAVVGTGFGALLKRPVLWTIIGLLVGVVAFLCHPAFLWNPNGLPS
jgi:hypothetical protein